VALVDLVVLLEAAQLETGTSGSGFSGISGFSGASVAFPVLVASDLVYLALTAFWLSGFSGFSGPAVPHGLPRRRNWGIDRVLVVNVI
jgi:hypothetical protein